MQVDFKQKFRCKKPGIMPGFLRSTLKQGKGLSSDAGLPVSRLHRKNPAFAGRVTFSTTSSILIYRGS
jgi:hypothetical protein